MRILFITLFFLLITPFIIRGEEINPFIPIIGKSYMEYNEELNHLHNQVNYATSDDEAIRILEQVRQVAQQTSDMRWKLEAGLFEISYKHRELIRHSPNATYTTQDAINDLQKLADKASECGENIFQIRALHRIFLAYKDILKNYEPSFDYARILVNLTEDIPSREFIDKLFIYRNIGDLYYNFQDYDEAAFFYQKILEDKELAFAYHYISSAYNSLGLVALYHKNDLELSNMYFQMILDLPATNSEEKWKDNLWKGIASSNLAYNFFLSGKLEEAIPLYKVGIKEKQKQKDYNFVTGSACGLAEVFILKNNLREAKYYLDLAKVCLDSSMYNKRYHLYYPVLSKYYITAGNNRLGLLYLDSALHAQEKYYKEFNAMKLVWSEQRAHGSYLQLLL